MTALELYQADAQAREAGDALTPRRAYFTELRDALYLELTHDGASPLLDQVVTGLRQKTLDEIYVLDYAALTECHSLLVDNQPLRDDETYIPHLLQHGQRVTWDALNAPGAYLVPTTRTMLSRFRALRTMCRRVHDARDETDRGSRETVSVQEAEQLQRLARMLDERCRDLESERAELLERIDRLEQGIIDRRLEKLIAERRAAAEAEINAETQRQREAATEAFRAQYAQEMASFAAERERAAREDAARQVDVTRDYDAIRQDMAAEMTRMQKRLETHITRYQQRLDRTEMRMLAMCFADAYPLLTTQLANLLLDARCAGAPAALLESLGRFQTQCAERLTQWERALSRLGLTVIRPAPGDAFDPMQHALSAAVDGTQSGGVIRTCLRPGVQHLSSGEVLSPALVTLC